MSSVPGRPAAWNRPTRSTWPRPLRRRCAASLNLVNACESGRPRTLLRPAADASSRPCRHWSPAPPRSGCRLQQLLCWMVSAMDKGGEMLSLLIAQCHYVFLYRDLFPGYQSAPSAATEPSSQTNTAESMTGTTRRRGQRPTGGGSMYSEAAGPAALGGSFQRSPGAGAKASFGSVAGVADFGGAGLVRACVRRFSSRSIAARRKAAAFGRTTPPQSRLRYWHDMDVPASCLLC